MPKRALPTEDEVKRVLAARKRHRGKGACYPCNQRKVKCDMNKPCGTCMKRNHPDICIYGQDSSRDATRPSSPSSESPIDVTGGTSSQDQDVSTNQSSFLGENSTPAYLRQMGGADSPIARDIVPALGLRNTLGQYPFINAETEDEKSRELVKLLPTRQEVLSFFHFYRTISFPLSPLIVDIEEFESYLGHYLESVAASGSSTKLSLEREGAACIALLLATLAAGAQYSNHDGQARRRISRDFAKRSFHALRLANFLLRPLFTSLQALLILGNFLQNDGNSDAAWALLGTTMRLAQSLGLHSEYGTVETVTEKEKLTGKHLWMTIVQQDCILSLCYDRPTATAYMPFVIGGNTDDNDALSYQRSMWEIARVGLSLLAKRGFAVNVNDLRQQIQSLQEIIPRTAKHLQSKEGCETLQDRMQFLLFSLHRSFCLAAICRPTFKSTHRIDQDSTFLDILSTGKKALADCLYFFLSLHAITAYPTRSWICIHEALSSALLLTILGEPRKSRSLSDMQKQLIDVLLSASEDDAPETNNSALTSSHLKALKTLQSLAQNVSAETVTETAISQECSRREPATGPGTSVAAQDETSFATSNDATFDLWQTDLSPMAFLDSIIWDKTVPENDTSFLGFEFGG